MLDFSMKFHVKLNMFAPSNYSQNVHWVLNAITSKLKGVICMFLKFKRLKSRCPKVEGDNLHFSHLNNKGLINMAWLLNHDFSVSSCPNDSFSKFLIQELGLGRFETLKHNMLVHTCHANKKRGNHGKLLLFVIQN